MKNKDKYYTVTRIVKEVFEIKASSRKEALDLVGTKGNPASITIIKETAKPVKLP